MSPGIMVACSFALTHGLAMVIGVRELRSLRGTRRGRPDGEAVPPVTQPLPPGGERKLPDCLIPKPMSNAPGPRVREFA